MKLDVKVEPGILAAVGRRLVQRHHVRKRHLPQVVEAHEHVLEHGGEVPSLGRGQCGQARVRRLRRDEDFVGIAREVRHEGNRRVVLRDDAAAVGVFRGEDVLEQHAAGLRQVPLACTRLGLDRLEHEVRRVDLTVRVRVRDADHFALVLEDEHVIDAVASAELPVLLLPDCEQPVDLRGLQLGEREVVPRAVADDAREAGGRPVAVDPGGRRELLRRARPDARVIVVEDEGARVGGLRAPLTRALPGHR